MRTGGSGFNRAVLRWRLAIRAAVETNARRSLIQNYSFCPLSGVSRLDWDLSARHASVYVDFNLEQFINPIRDLTPGNTSASSTM
jgi:hypothetical protein